MNTFSLFWRRIYRILASVKLALALLIVILTCCVIGVTAIRGERAWALIFSTLWFNAILVALVVNVAFCFFGRIWGRKVTLVSFGMILFHLSFVAILAGVVYNSLFYFRGMIRLTEGETLVSGDPESYDYADLGRFFSYEKLRGETSLLNVHRGYKVEGLEKQIAYDVAVGEDGAKKQGIVYVTHKLSHNGFDYFRDKEGYSLLIMLYDRWGRELYGAFVSLQSLKQKGDSYLYTTGTKEGPGGLPFPQDPLHPMYDLQVEFQPSYIKERAGDVVFQVRPFMAEGKRDEKPFAEGKRGMGKKIMAGDHYLAVTEVRYWVGMSVSYEPGKPIVLTSLWVGLGGMIITFIGRMRRGGK